MVKIDIKMPTYCYDCPCHNGENGRCNITGETNFDKRPFDCPLEGVTVADAAPVKHAKWIDVRAYCGDFMCSNCKGLFSTNRYNFCPDCGAKMDGKENE